MNKSATKNIIKIAINTLIGAILVIVWLQFVNFKEISAFISKVEPLKLLPIFLFMFFSPALRAFRLKIFLSPVKKIAFKDLVFLNGLAMLLNFFIPIRAGELAKGFYLNGVYKLPLAKSVVWTFMDRFIDFFVVLVLAVILLPLVGTSLPPNLIPVITSAVVLITTVTYLMIYQVKIAQKLFNLISWLLFFKVLRKYFNRLSQFFLEAFAILKRKPTELLSIFLVTLLAYGADAFIFYFGFAALNHPQPFLKMYLGQLLSALTYLIPAAPGYVGSAEAAGVLVFSGILGIETNLASAVVVLNHVLTIIFILIYGLTSVYFLEVNLGSLISRIFSRSNS